MLVQHLFHINCSSWETTSSSSAIGIAVCRWLAPQLMTPFTKRRRKTNKPEENYLNIHLRDKERVKMNEIISLDFYKIFAVWPIVNA